MPMTLVEILMKNAQADTEMLESLDARGDDFGIERDVEFVLVAESADVAELVRDFVNDHQHGRASAAEVGGRHLVTVVVFMPLRQHVLASVSGFMACIAKLFGVVYDGWGCEARLRG